MPMSATNTMVGSEVWIADVPAGSPLPPELSEFKGHIVNSDGQIQWKPGTETNTPAFVAERSLDGRNYRSFGSVTAADSPGVHYYDFTDPNIISLGVANIYYRLTNRYRWQAHLFQYCRVVCYMRQKNLCSSVLTCQV